MQFHWFLVLVRFLKAQLDQQSDSMIMSVSLLGTIVVLSRLNVREYSVDLTYGL